MQTRAGHGAEKGVRPPLCGAQEGGKQGKAGQGRARESRARQGRAGQSKTRVGTEHRISRRRPRASIECPESLVKNTIPCEHDTTTFPEVTVWGLTVIWSLGESEAPQSSRAEEGGARQCMGGDAD